MNEDIFSRKINLYHLICGHPSLDDTKPIIPRVPCNKFNTEDASIKRICTAPSLDECLTGIGPNIIGLHFLREMMRQNNQKVDLSKVTLPFTMVKFCVDRNAPDVWLPGKTAKYVPDAWMTQECWLTKPMVPDEIKKLWLVNGDISKESLLYQNEKYSYFVISDSTWSETEKDPDFNFVKELVKVTESWLEQELEPIQKEVVNDMKPLDKEQESLNSKILGAIKKTDSSSLKSKKQTNTELTL